MDTITLTIDGQEVRARKGATVLEAAREAGIYIPALCAHPDLPPWGACRLCIVEIEGIPGFPSSCSTPAVNGMIVRTNTPQVADLRRNILELILTEHPHGCLICDKKGTPECSPLHLVEQKGLRPCNMCPKKDHCELQKVADYIDIKEVSLPSTLKNLPVDKSDPLFDRDYNLCILCARCVRICHEVRGVGAIDFLCENGQIVGVGPIGQSLKDSGCKFCGACVEVCPTGALMDRGIGFGTEREADLVSCSHKCPAEVDIPRYVRFIAEGRFTEAAAVVREKVPFPATLARVCLHPCETACRRGQLSEPISVKALKRFALEQDKGLWKQNFKVQPPTGKRVAIVGSGPAGLTAAYYLAKLGHSTTVFEALAEPGGMMKVGIPAYRLPREVLDAEIEEIKSLGIEMTTNTRVESLDNLFQQGYQAIFLGIGAHRGIRIGVAGEDSPGVLEGISFLKNVNLGKGIKLGDKIGVVGGGNAAIDAARIALRLGAKVNIIYRRTQADMPANPDEVEAALHEGLEILFFTAPVSLRRENAGIKMPCVRMKPGKKWDSKGRRLPEPIAGSEFDIDFDTVILAIGQQPDIPQGFNLLTGEGNTIQVDPDTLATSREGVFAGGDAVTGPASVIEAIAAGRKAASSIDRYLGGDGRIDEALAPDELPDPWLGRDEDFANWNRVKMPLLPLDQRLASFGEVELGFSEDEAITEAQRCLRCSLRLCITRSIMAPIHPCHEAISVVE